LSAHHNPSWQLGFEHERELQAVAASRLVEDLLGERELSYVVLAGDFNAAPDSASVRFWRGLQSLGERASTTGTPGRVCTPGIPTTRSRRATRW
jgi:endonuclease/exonuclease/phosphatase family metal-dependent hydrolase